jgi:urocanate reductase
MINWDLECDVLVVGSGAAGLSAAIAAHDAGARALVIEKDRHVGGNTIISGGAVNSVDPARQSAQGIKDSVNLFFQHTYNGGDQLADPKKVQYLVENCREQCLLYLERLGVIWSEKVFRGYGSLHERTFTALRYKGWHGGAAIIHALLDQVISRKMMVLVEHRVTQILREKGAGARVIGVEVEHGKTQKFIRARRAIILATGGFAANKEWVSYYDPRLSQLETSNRPTSTGECIEMACNIGADTIHMEYIQASLGKPRRKKSAMLISIDSKDVREICTSRPYKIFVNKYAIRFVDEGDRRDVISRAVLKQVPFQAIPGKAKAMNLHDLATKLGIEPRPLGLTVQRYNNHCHRKQDMDFNKHPNLLIPLLAPPFHGETLTLLRHYTMGGLRTKGMSGSVLDKSGNVIPGLYAAGEVSGGIHGSNRLGNNSLPDCIVFGGACGEFAAGDNTCRKTGAIG